MFRCELSVSGRVTHFWGTVTFTQVTSYANINPIKLKLRSSRCGTFQQDNACKAVGIVGSVLMYDLLIKGWWKTSEAHNLIVWPNIPPLVLNFQDECDAMTSEKQPEKLKQLILLLQDLFSDLDDTVAGLQMVAVGVLWPKDQTWIQNKYWPDWIDGRWLELFFWKLERSTSVACGCLSTVRQEQKQQMHYLRGAGKFHSAFLPPSLIHYGALQVDDTYPLSMSINAHMKWPMTRCPRAFKKELGSPKQHQTKTQTGSDCLQQFHLVFLYVCFY